MLFTLMIIHALKSKLKKIVPKKVTSDMFTDDAPHKLTIAYLNNMTNLIFFVVSNHCPTGKLALNCGRKKTMDYNISAGDSAGAGGDVSLLNSYRLLFCVGAALSVLLLASFTVIAFLFFHWRESGGLQLFVAALTIFALTNSTVLICVIARERSKQAAVKQEHELEILKSNFITLASHEFRTPLSSLLLSATLIEKYAGREDPGSVVKHTYKIKQVVHRMENMLEDFLSLEKLDAGQVTAAPTSFNIGVLCRFMIAEASLTAAAAQRFSYEATGNTEMVNLDEVLLRNALGNLLSNAAKYAGEGANIRLLTDISSKRVSVSVRDDGPGIAEKDQGRLFSAFYRVHDSGSIPGTGLGLYLVKRYVQLMGGTLKFYSKPLDETCFEMIFPTADDD